MMTRSRSVEFDKPTPGDRSRAKRKPRMASCKQLFAQRTLRVTHFLNWKSHRMKEATNASWIELEAEPTPVDSHWMIEWHLAMT